MRQAFWPDSTATEVDRLLAATDAAGATDDNVLVADLGNRRLGGFAELGSRKYAEGCATSPVAYLEGIWVDPDARRQRVAAELIRSAEEWARGHGFTELASDCEIDNLISESLHQAVGFEEVARIVCFRRKLGTDANQRSD